MDIPSEEPFIIQENSLPLFFCTFHPKLQLILVCTDIIQCPHPGLVCAQCVQESHLTHSLSCLSDIIADCTSLVQPIFLAQTINQYSKIDELQCGSALVELDKAVENTLDILDHFRSKINSIFHKLENTLKQHVINLRKQAFSSLGDVGEMLKFIHQPVDSKDITQEQFRLQKQLRTVLKEIHLNNTDMNENDIKISEHSINDCETDLIKSQQQQYSLQKECRNDQKSNKFASTKQKYFEDLVYRVIRTMNKKTTQQLDEYVNIHVEGLADYQSHIKNTIDSLIDQTATLLHTCSETK